MTTVSSTQDPQSLRTTRRSITDIPADSRAFDWLIVFVSLWTLAGGYVDGWAHNTMPLDIETFFTPWHAILYSGVTVSLLVLGIAYLRNVLRGYHWTHALPRGYMLSLLGVIIFGASGVFDMI